MDMLKRLRRLACRHQYGWAERRHAEVCYHCGQVREETDEPADVRGRQAPKNER